MVSMCHRLEDVPEPVEHERHGGGYAEGRDKGKSQVGLEAASGGRVRLSTVPHAQMKNDSSPCCLEQFCQNASQSLLRLLYCVMWQ